MIQEEWFNERLTDGGPIYAETNFDRIVVEPWNAVSSLIIILPAVFWFFRTGGRRTEFRFLMTCILLMILGGTGSALFHAFRAHRFFLLLDIIPSAILTLLLSFYFWMKILRHWWIVILIVIPLFLIRMVFFRTFPQHMAINLSYALTGIAAGLPLVLFLVRSDFYRIWDVAASVICLSIALLFREADVRTLSFLPMGTHFLWHLFSGIGAYYLLSYLYHLKLSELQTNQLQKQVV